MAIIQCPECTKNVSDKAKSCPHCGFPIEENGAENLGIEMPELPNNLDIGEMKGFESFGLTFDGELENKINETILLGNVTVISHEHGFRIENDLAKYDIHDSQIINMKIATHKEIEKIDKSIVGRGLIGGLILGPAGLILGGMTGLKTSEKSIEKNYFIINYWDIHTKEIQTILISGEQEDMDPLIKYHNETTENINEYLDSKKISTSTAWLIFILIIIILAITSMLFK